MVVRFEIDLGIAQARAGAPLFGERPLGLNVTASARGRIILVALQEGCDAVVVHEALSGIG